MSYLILILTGQGELIVFGHAPVVLSAVDLLLLLLLSTAATHLQHENFNISPVCIT
jgi:hypothetical protein